MTVLLETFEAKNTGEFPRSRLSTFRRDEKKLRKTPLFRLSFPSKNVEGRGGRAFIVTVRRW